MKPETYWDPEYLDLLADALDVLDKNHVQYDPEKESVVRDVREYSERVED